MESPPPAVFQDKYERTQQGNLLGWMVLQIVQSSSKDYLGLAVKLKHVGECYAAGRQPCAQPAQRRQHQSPHLEADLNSGILFSRLFSIETNQIYGNDRF